MRQFQLALDLLLAAFFICVVKNNNVAEGAEFNYEVEKRVLEHLSNFMSAPVLMTTTISNMLVIGGVFNHDLKEQDRDAFLRVAASLPVYHIYYSLEDGTTVV